jgi:glycosyltransferase involved in cell wall biosynthesis
MSSVTVILTTFKEQDFVRAAIDTVRRQTFTDYECLIIDDGSSEEFAAGVTQLIVGDPRFSFHSHSHTGGPAEGRNWGIKHARGEFVTTLDADDTWAPERLFKLVSFLENAPTVGVVFHDAVLVDEQDPQRTEEVTSVFSQLSSDRLSAYIYCNGCMGVGGAMFRRSVFMKHGLFLPQREMPTSEDYEIVLRISPYEVFGHLREVLATFRRGRVEHRGNAGLRGYEARLRAWDLFDDANPQIVHRIASQRRRARSQLLLSMSRALWWSGDRDRALKAVRGSIRLRPTILGCSLVILWNIPGGEHFSFALRHLLRRKGRRPLA